MFTDHMPAVRLPPDHADALMAAAIPTQMVLLDDQQWGLGDPLTGRDVAARTFSHAFTLDTPRDPATWPAADPRPVPPTSRMRSAWARPCPPWAKPFSTRYGLRGAEQHPDRGTAHRPQRSDPPSRHCTSSTTSWRSNSPCCTRRPGTQRPRHRLIPAGRIYNLKCPFLKAAGSTAVPRLAMPCPSQPGDAG
jgi:hypothetical protein